MWNGKASTSQNEKNDPAPQRQFMEAAAENIKNDSIRLLGLLKGEEGSRDQQLIRNHDADHDPQRPLMRNELHRAAIEGNKNDLIRLLRFQGGEDSQDHEVTVELSGNAPKQIRTTMEKVEDIKSATYIGDTVLHILATYGHSELVPMCYQKERALLTSQNKNLETPLHCAAKAGQGGVVSELIKLARSEGEKKLKQFLRVGNCNEETALHEAARHGHAEVAFLLMQEDPDLARVGNNENISPLYMATARGSIGVVRTIVEKLFDRVVTPAFYSGPNGQTALHAAVLQDAGRELIKLHNINHHDGIRGYFYEVRKLIKYEYPAFSHSFTELILQLSSDTPLLRKADATGNTPLHFAASVGCHYLAELLLKNDASLGYLRNSDGLFPVHVASCKGHVKTIIVFLKRCIDSYQLLDKTGKNFLHIAAEENRLEVFMELMGKPRKNDGIPRRDEIFKNMANTRDSEGNTPLHLAVLKGNQSVIRALLSYKALDFDLQNKKGLTALDLSAIEDQKGNSISEGMQFWTAKYITEKRIKFSPAWFEHFIDEKLFRRELLKTKELSSNDKIQTLGLGSVLTSTVAFAAAFTVPGGYNSINGSPILGRKYVFKAFILADVLAFAFAFMSTMDLISCCISNLKQDEMDKRIKLNAEYFTVAANSLAMAMALGLFVVLAPVCNGIAIVAFVVVGFLLLGKRIHKAVVSKEVSFGKQTMLFLLVPHNHGPELDFTKRLLFTTMTNTELLLQNKTFKYSISELVTSASILAPIAFICLFALLK